MKMLVQFHDGQMVRQRIVAGENELAQVFGDLMRCGIDMRTVIATSRHAENYPVGWLHYEYPLVGDSEIGVWGGA